MRPRFILYALGIFAARPSGAFRNPQFPLEIKNQATLFTRQEAFFAGESAADKLRPVWLHGGDSLSVAWGARSTLRERIDGEATIGEVPETGTAEDLAVQMPSVDFNWATGRKLNYGLLGWLQRETKEQWVVLSTALVGTSYDGDDVDPIALMINAKQKERTRLVTFSLGGNDLCYPQDPTENGRLKNRLDVMKKSFLPGTVIVPWAVPHVKKLRERAMNRLAELPNSPAKDRMIAYCQSAWRKHCQGAETSSMDKITRIRDRINKTLEDSFGPLFEIDNLAQDLDTLDMMAADCFHPGRDAQNQLDVALAKHIKDHYRVPRK